MADYFDPEKDRKHKLGNYVRELLGFDPKPTTKEIQLGEADILDKILGGSQALRGGGVMTGGTLTTRERTQKAAPGQAPMQKPGGWPSGGAPPSVPSRGAPRDPTVRQIPLPLYPYRQEPPVCRQQWISRYRKRLLGR